MATLACFKSIFMCNQKYDLTVFVQDAQNSISSLKFWIIRYTMYKAILLSVKNTFHILTMLLLTTVNAKHKPDIPYLHKVILDDSEGDK